MNEKGKGQSGPFTAENEPSIKSSGCTQAQKEGLHCDLKYKWHNHKGSQDPLRQP